MNVDEWQKRLKDTFSVGEITGGALLEVINAESDYTTFITTRFRGHLILMDSFGAFSLETLRLAEAQYRSGSIGKQKWYPRLLLEEVMNFKRVRAAENLLLRGYPSTGYGLLRDLKDRAAFIAGIAKGYTTIERLHGLVDVRGKTSLTQDDMETIHRSRLSGIPPISLTLS